MEIAAATSPYLQKGIALARMGQASSAFTVFQQILIRNPRDVDAWLWLAQVVNDPEKKRECYLRVARIDPRNQAAQAGLAELEGAVPIAAQYPRSFPTRRAPAVTVPAELTALLPETSTLQPPLANTPAANPLPANGAANPLPEKLASPLAATGFLGTICPACGEMNRRDSNFCTRCGTRIAPSGVAVPAPVSAVTSVSSAPASAPATLAPAVSASAASASAASVSASTAPPAADSQSNASVVPAPLPAARVPATRNVPTEPVRPAALSALRPGAVPASQAVPTQPAPQRATAALNAASQTGSLRPQTTGSLRAQPVTTAVPALSPDEVRRLINDLLSKNDEALPGVLCRLKDYRVRAAIPALMACLRRPRGLHSEKRSRTLGQLLDVLDYLLVVPTDTEVVHEISQWSRKHLGFYLFEPVETCIRILVRFGMYEAASEMLKNSVNAGSSDPRYVLLMGQVPTSVAVRLLCRQVQQVRKIYGPRLSLIPAVIVTDPVLLPVTAGLGARAVSGLSNYAGFNSPARGSASLMILPSSVAPEAFRALPEPVQMMTTLHCYSTALATIASRNPDLVRQALYEHLKPLEQGIIGLALAMAGDAPIEPTMIRLTGDADWIVRIFAYEALVVLNDMRGMQPGPAQINGLSDRDVRVVGAVASAMAATRSPIYVPHILRLAKSPEQRHRETMLPVLARMTLQGDGQARAFLQSIATSDPQHKVREMACDLLRAMP